MQTVTPKSLTLKVGNAFTLVELLVVVAIIGILASMLLPALARAKLASQTIRCLNGLKQLGTVFQLYGDDYNGYIVPNQNNSVYEPSGMWYIRLRDNYGVKSHAQSVASGGDSDIMICWTNYEKSKASIPAADTKPTSASTYGYNTMTSRGINYNSGNTSDIYIKYQRINNPSQRFILADKYLGNDKCFDCTNPLWETYPFTPTTYVRGFSYEHGRATNILFLDGHCESRKFGEIPSTLGGMSTIQPYPY